MHSVKKALTIDLGADRPGSLAKAFEAIAKAGVNVDGYAEIGGTLHLLTPDVAATRRALEASGLRVQQEEEVVLVEVADHPGVGAKIFRAIADANVNVKYSYVGTGNRVIIGADNIGKVADIFAKETAITR